jgi:hypothetical protein
MEGLDPSKLEASRGLSRADQMLNVHPPPHGGTVVTSRKSRTVLGPK